MQKINKFLRKENKMPTVDMDSAGSFEVYPSGTYKCRVIDWEFGESSKKKTKQVRFKCSIDVQGNWKPYTEFIPITDASVWKVANFISAAGINMGGKMDTDSALFGKTLDALKDRSLYITLEHDEQYNNNKSMSYARDEDQEEEEFIPVDDTPEFAK